MRYELPYIDATEFLLRHTYRDRWLEELREQYLFFTQK